MTTEQAWLAPVVTVIYKPLTHYLWREPMSNVQAVFGQFAVEINGNVEMFATEAEAQTAYDADANAAGYLAKATAYTDHKGLIEKNAKGKINVIVDFLAFIESYDADAVVDAPVAEATEATEAAADGPVF